MTFQLTKQYLLAKIIMIIWCILHSPLSYSLDTIQRIQHAEPVIGQSVKSSIVSNKRARAPEGCP